MAKIYLIRHGQASFSADDYDQLSDTGIEQAKLLNQAITTKQLQPDVIVTGSMLRHKQTAQYSLPNSNLVQQDERWNEYDHQNILAVYKKEFSTPQLMREFLRKQANPIAAFQQHFIAAIEQWISTPESESDKYTESWDAFKNRVISALKHYAEQYQGQTILIYSSGGPISLVASYLQGLPLTQFIRVNWTLVNGGITKVIARGEAKKLMLSTLNEHNIFEQHNKKLITYT